MNKVIRGFALYGSILVAGALIVVSPSLLAKNHSNALNARSSQPDFENKFSQPNYAEYSFYIKEEKESPWENEYGVLPSSQSDDLYDDEHMFPFWKAIKKAIGFSSTNKLPPDFLKNNFNLSTFELKPSQHTKLVPIGFNEHFSIKDGVLSGLTDKGKEEKKLTIPKSIVQINADAFKNCNKDLETIDIQSTKLKIDASAWNSVPKTTKFCVVSEAMKKELINSGIDDSRISIVSSNQSLILFIVVGALIVLIAGGVAAKLIHVKLKNRTRTNGESK